MIFKISTPLYYVVNRGYENLYPVQQLQNNQVSSSQAKHLEYNKMLSELVLNR